MFKLVSAKVNFPQLEENILKFWKRQHIFEKSVQARQDAPRFTLYEGPPTINGSPGIHHVLARVFKDVMARYKTMKGYHTPRKAGWDTHGLPVELEVEKSLGFSSKSQIEQYGVAQFNKLCRESVLRYLKEWETMTERIGFWLDMEHPYITLDNGYIKSCWWAIKQLWNRNLIYQGYKVTPHCPRCGTSLSSHEVALGYKDDAEDPSVYIKFKLTSKLPAHGSPEVYHRLYTSGKPTYFLTWTTTPWTLPGNTALAVAPDAEYVKINGKEDCLVLASTLVGRVGLKGYHRVDTFSGTELIGQEYEPLFRPSDFGVPTKRLGPDYYDEALRGEDEPPEAYHITSGDFVSTEEGTGIVHIAPAFGEIDYETGKANRLYLVLPVNLEGKVTGTFPFAGLFVKDADPLIIDDLKSRGLLYRSEQIRHTYPFCWRCESPLLYYAKSTWYIRTTAVKERLLSGNAHINWYPEHIKYGRFGDWLENNIDWAFSRERYWGTPLPLWRCHSCGDYECVGSIDELGRKDGLTGLVEPLDLHRPFVDRITFSCSRCGGTMQRIPEVIDCWFDSGAMPIAQWHYPFENQEEFGQSFPADFICEAVDQTRGWFYSLHAISTLLFDRPCFRNVICLGHILDAKGEKMSKAKGNVIDPRTLLNSYGADALRWYLFTASPAGNVRCFSTEAVVETLRKFLLTLWNTYSFFVIYANIDQFNPKLASAPQQIPDLDNWILSELNQLIKEVTTALDKYDPTEAGRRIENFVDNLSNWYVRRSRRRFWKSENDADKLAAHYTLYQCLVTLAKLLAPFIPFVAEEIYQNLVCSADTTAPESVHLADFPLADLSKINAELMSDIHLVMKVVSLGRAVRNKAGIKVRQPLSKALVKVRSKQDKAAGERLASQVLDELNVKEIEFAAEEVELSRYDKPSHAVATEGDYWVAINTDISSELAAEGTAREVVHRLQTMRRTAGFDIADYIITYYQGKPAIEQVIKQFADYIKQETLSRELLLGDPNGEAFSQSHHISGYQVVFGMKKV